MAIDWSLYSIDSNGNLIPRNAPLTLNPQAQRVQNDTGIVLRNPLPTPETVAPAPGTPDAHVSMVVNPPPANYAPGATTGGPNPPPPPTPTPTTGGTNTNASAKAFFDQLFPGTTLSPQMLLDNKDALAAHGITLIPNAAGQPGKIQLPDGSVFDVIIGAGAGTNQKAWNQIAGPGGSTAGFGGGGGTSGMDWGAVGQMLSNLGYAPGSVFAPWTQTWAPPTAEQALQSPGVQFAMNNAMRLMQNSAAARGVLGNARAQEAIAQNLGQDLLGQYQNIRGMALGDYLQNQQDFFANQDRPFNKFMQGTNIGLNAAQLG